MSSDNHSIPEYFKDGGPLSSAIPEFSERAGQSLIASQIQQSIGKPVNLVIEAGTGTGKTLAYLLPILLSGKRAIVSTGTKNLQDQLFYRDLPDLLGLVPDRVSVAVLKGRSNYLCPRKLELNLSGSTGNWQPEELDKLQRIREWSTRTHVGDLSEVDQLVEDSPVWRAATSTTDSCLVSRCRWFDQCPFYAARERADQADLVLVNHHLLYADLINRKESFLINKADLIVVDEAHQVADIARHFLGESISSWQLIELVYELKREAIAVGDGEGVLRRVTEQLLKENSALHRCYLALRGRGIESIFEDAEVHGAVTRIDSLLVNLIDYLYVIRSRSEGLDRCYDRCVAVNDQFAFLTGAVRRQDGCVHYVESDELGFRVSLIPVDIADELGALCESQGKTWIYTSATLAINGDFSLFLKELGLPDDSPVAHFESPFPYDQQVLTYQPDGLPHPRETGYTEALVDDLLPIILANQGKTFFLFTSHHALNIAFSMLKHQKEVVVIAQGLQSRHLMLQKFREVDRCILLGSQSFWEGVDVKGTGLTLLIVDKLPFPNPVNALIEGRTRQLVLEGREPFTEFFLPQAIMALRQGFGRLIREFSDRGVFVLGDPRLRQQPYGDTIMKALPNMPSTSDKNRVMTYLKAIQPRGRNAVISDL